MFFNAPVLIQSDAMEGGALSDDDFQDESLFTHRKPAATVKRAHHEATKVCVATGSCRNTKLTLNKYLSFIQFSHQDRSKKHVYCMHKHSMRKSLYIYFYLNSGAWFNFA